MSIRRYIYDALLLLSAMIMTGCAKEVQPEVLEGTGTVNITVSAPVETKSPLAADQDKMIKTLSVWLVNGTTGKVEDISFSTPDAVSSVVTFHGVERGDHKLYIVANYSELDSSYPVGATIDNTFLNTTLGPVSDASCPSFTSESGIPSSIVMDISVAPGTNNISAELLRVVGRMSITFRNAVQDFDLYVGDIILARRNVSKGYLFQKEDHSKPADAVAVNFPALGGMKKLSEGSRVKIYDHYLFETSNDFVDPFTLSFAAGLYPAGTPESSVEYTSTTTQVDVLSSLGDATNTRSNVNDLYFIKHSSGNRYMCVEDGALVLKEVSSDAELLAMENDEFRKYLWRLSATGGTARIIHDQTGKEITYTTNGAAGLADSGSGRSLTVTTNSTTVIRFAYEVSSGWRNYTYYLAPNTGYTGMLGSTSTSGNGRNWNLRKVTVGQKDVVSMGFAGAEKDVSTDRVHTIRYIDKYGLPVPLLHICRNEHVDIIINIQYNSEIGHFDFAVEPWGKVDNETTFD